MPPSRADMLRGFIQQRPDDPFPRYALAQELKNNGDLAAAWKEFQHLLDVHPDYRPAYLHAGNLLVAQGKRDEARAVYTRGVDVCARAGDGHAQGELQGALAALDH